MGDEHDEAITTEGEAVVIYWPDDNTFHSDVNEYIDNHNIYHNVTLW